MNEDVQLIWEAYVIEDVDIGPPIEHHGEPGGLEHLDRPLAKHGDAFHQFLLSWST